MTKLQSNQQHNIYGEYLAFSDYADLAAAISAVNAIIIASGKNHALLIDANVDLTGDTPTIHNFDFPVIVQKQYKLKIELV
mgnify:CR=1 FL=1